MTRGLGGQSPANVSHHLQGIDFPASKDDLVECAKKNGADDKVIDKIESLPDQQYNDMADVMKGYSS